ncbi:class I SAM-dependent methyltransferase [Nocardioides luteus]|uniref:class I SAM-dependent methyltransferase n=1 Tax=Nocardioides luteus TaxID=1844 RepID=UPI000AA1FF8E|nr:class I SAM-dependent methyltransferase [Nocardioides luteus]
MTRPADRPTGPVRTWLADGTIDTDELKSCCAAGYSSDLAALLLGDSYHPGGRRLTRRLLDALSVRPGDRLVDVACGIGTTSLLAADEYGLSVDGVDLSERSLDRARATAEAAGLTARFHHGDAESLPLANGGWDVVMCECALCTFPDKPTAIAGPACCARAAGPASPTSPPTMTGSRRSSPVSAPGSPASPTPAPPPSTPT